MFTSLCNIYVQAYILTEDPQLINGQDRIQNEAIRHKNQPIRPISHMHLPVQYSEEKKRWEFQIALPQYFPSLISASLTAIQLPSGTQYQRIATISNYLFIL